MEDTWSIFIIFFIIFSTVHGPKIVLSIDVNRQSSDISCEHKDCVTIRQSDTTTTTVSVISLVHETDEAVHFCCINNVSNQTVLDCTLIPGVSVDNLTLDFTVNGTLQMYLSQPSNMECRCDTNESCCITYKVSFDEDANGLQHIAHHPYFELPHVSKFDALFVMVLKSQSQRFTSNDTFRPHVSKFDVDKEEILFRRYVPTVTLSTASNDIPSSPQSENFFIFMIVFTVLLVLVCSLLGHRICIRCIRKWWLYWLTRLMYRFIMRCWLNCCGLVRCFIKNCLFTCCRLVCRFIMKKRNAEPLLPMHDTTAHPYAFTQLVVVSHCRERQS